jgi:hypothetical protein
MITYANASFRFFIIALLQLAFGPGILIVTQSHHWCSGNTMGPKVREMGNPKTGKRSNGSVQPKAVIALTDYRA